MADVLIQFNRRIERPEMSLSGAAEKVKKIVLSAIAERRSRNPITSKEIIKEVKKTTGEKLTDAEIRQIVSRSRSLGGLIGSSGKGYYKIATKRDFEETVKHLTGRVGKILYILQGMEKKFYDTNEPTLFEQKEGGRK